MDEQTVRDLHRRYAGTVIKITEIATGKSSVEAIHSIELGGDGIAYLVVHANGDRVAKKLINYEFNDTPDSCVFEVDGIPFIYRVRPERQWRKGICHENSSIESPFLEMLQHLQMEGSYFINYQINNYSKKTIAKLYEPTVYKLEEALKQIEQGKVAAVTTAKNFISVSHKEDSFILWRMNRPLCFFDPNKKEATCFDGNYRQEVMDFFSRQGEYYNAN